MEVQTVTCIDRYKRRRTVALVVGAEYVIDPLNPRKVTNRGRRVRLLKHEPFDKLVPIEVYWLDTKRRGSKVAADELLPVEAAFLLEDVALPGRLEDKPDPPPIAEYPPGFAEAIKKYQPGT